ncbi:hypothetical protein ACFYYD_10600, partial [Streptomyces bluensis]
MAAYRLLYERATWTRLLIDLELVADASPSIRNRARSDIAMWLIREAATTYSMPQGRTADALTRQLGPVGGIAPRAGGCVGGGEG